MEEFDTRWEECKLETVKGVRATGKSEKLKISPQI